MKYDNYVRLEVLTPVHIGSGDTCDPLDYVMTTKEGVDYFCQIDLGAWLEDYPQQEELAKVLDGGNLAIIRKYIADNLDADIYARNRSRVFSAEIGQKYKEHIAKTNSPNQLLIDPALKNPLTSGLLIPGSSIKGAIRTAVIDWCDNNWHLNLKNSRNPREYTQTLDKALGSISDSAFKQLKIGDFEAINNASAIVIAKEKSIKAEKNNGTPKNSCEVCLSTVTEETAQEIYGRIAIGKQDKTQDAILSCTMNGKTKSWTLAELMQLVNDFYQTRYEDEKRKFYHQRHFATTNAAIKLLDEQYRSLQPNQMILRVGHYSHIEAMTITHNKPVGKKGFGKTRTLADGAHPFGWIKLSLCTKEDYLNYQQKKLQTDAAQATQRQQLRLDKIALRQQQLQQQLHEEQQQAQLEQQRLAKQEDEQKNPWKKMVRQIENIKTWGDLKQHILENEQLSQFKEVEAFTEVVYHQALQVRNQASKWDDARDQQLADWFELSSKSWDKLETQATVNALLDEQQLSEIEAIKTLNDWGAYKTSGMKLEDLTMPALRELMAKFKQWGCDNKNAKKEKYNEWKKVRQLVSKK